MKSYKGQVFFLNDVIFDGDTSIIVFYDDVLVINH